MVKESFYNHYVNEECGVLLYNALHDSYLVVSRSFYEQFNSSKDNLYVLKISNEKLYETLEMNGFIVDDDFDELMYYRNKVFKTKFTTNTYEVIINPTMDCNLNCWYCYESHVEKSLMTAETANSIVKHIKTHYLSTHFKNLVVSFFGGEPLMNQKIVKQILTDLKVFAEKEGVVLNVVFTTNGTLLNTDLLNFLKDYSVSFQITIDGDKVVHNTVRHFKKSKEDTYDRIVDAVKQTTEILDNYNITVRINYNQETLNTLYPIVNDMVFADRGKLRFSLHRIWQVDKDEVCWEDVFKFINFAQKKGFDARILALEPKNRVCYADIIGEVVINYNGDVFKCTARDFSNAEPDGVLQENGNIEWNISRLTQRLYTEIPKICMECKLLPACPGICSQHIIENGNGVGCILDTNLSKDDYIVYNFNRYALKSEIFLKEKI